MAALQVAVVSVVVVVAVELVLGHPRQAMVEQGYSFPQQIRYRVMTQEAPNQLQSSNHKNPWPPLFRHLSCSVQNP